MSASIHNIKQDLKKHDFRHLFRDELGWDQRPQSNLSIEYRGQYYTFQLLAEKEAFKIYLHTCDSSIPALPLLKELDKRLNEQAAAHLTIFADAKKENQLWLWVKREKGAIAYPTRLNKLQSGDILAQKVRNLYVSFEEEEKGELTLIDIINRVTQGFDVEKVANKFFDGFKEQHKNFLKEIRNIPDEEDRKHYTSIMLNRLMFVYFIQRKGLLDNSNPNSFDGRQWYLQERLEQIQKTSDDDSAFYKFLRRLFHEGLNKPENEHSDELKSVIGDIPYLNGGIFDEHSLEVKYQNIEISNEAFKNLFKFFTKFNWHLDDRSSRVGDEINPDVLGYIFEKYINQKQMGAYYTKEDITGYISQNTIIPYIFERVSQQYPDAFLPAGPIWSLLRENPDTYIYEALSHGYTEEFPADIAAGIADITRRTRWNQAAVELDEDGNLTTETWRGALPTETWREIVARRQRYDEVRQLIVAGKITSINDLITYNLNIRQFAFDVISKCTDPILLRLFYDTLTKVTVLDPTCGSGAFLFATLNILKPLYQACLECMRSMLAEYKLAPNYVKDFQEFLNHMGQPYHFLKSIIVNNLYGVDIMDEAIEVCKLRLFLALVAQLKAPKDREPLPDIDFNVLAGNALIGFTSLDEVRRVVNDKLLPPDETKEMLAEIEALALEIKRDEQHFRNIQTDQKLKLEARDIAEYKKALRSKLDKLRAKLDRYLATTYGIGTYPSKYLSPGDNVYPHSEEKYEAWKETHRPFHWWAEFYGIMQKGGFDVVIGNPPYVEYGKEMKKVYQLIGYQTIDCGNLYAFTTERMKNLSKQRGRVGVIIPVASVCTDGYLTLQKLLTNSECLVVSNYNDRPSKLFDGLEHIRLSIILSYGTDDAVSSIFTTKYNKWNKSERDYLFNKLSYTKATNLLKEGSIPKLQVGFEADILQKVIAQKKALSLYTRKSSNHPIYYTRKLSGFVQILDRVPLIYDAQGALREPSELKNIAFETAAIKNTFLSVLNSNLFYWFLTIYSDCRNLNKREVYSIKFDYERASQKTIQDLSDLSQRLMKDFDDHSRMLEMNYEKQGKMSIQCFYPKLSKPIIDEIDRVLAQHYGFTDEELDFIINYDIKYRMGRDNGDEGEE